MLLCFELRMPNISSWNGKWSGQDDLYVRIRQSGRSKKDIKNAQEILQEGSYYYDFGDGWGAEVFVTKVNANEAAKFRRKSSGFCGYDWMITSIINHGEIKPEG